MCIYIYVYTYHKVRRAPPGASIAALPVFCLRLSWSSAAVEAACMFIPPTADCHVELTLPFKCSKSKKISLPSTWKTSFILQTLELQWCLGSSLRWPCLGHTSWPACSSSDQMPWRFVCIATDPCQVFFGLSIHASFLNQLLIGAPAACHLRQSANSLSPHLNWLHSRRQLAGWNQGNGGSCTWKDRLLLRSLSAGHWDHVELFCIITETFRSISKQPTFAAIMHGSMRAITFSGLKLAHRSSISGFGSLIPHSSLA